MTSASRSNEAQIKKRTAEPLEEGDPEEMTKKLATKGVFGPGEAIARFLK